MLRIQRSVDEGVVFSLSGRIGAEGVAEMQRLLSLETGGQSIALDLRDATLVDRDGVRFLARCEAEGVKLEHCPAYVREWIETERNQCSRQRRVDET
jgi:hypothetical protein